MIAGVEGPPGAGKTYYCVRKIAEALESGKVVATNATLVADFETALANRHLLRLFIPGRRRQLAEDWRRSFLHTEDLSEVLRVRLHGRGEGRGVLLLDEAHHWLNSRLWKEEDRLYILRFFSQHRKLGWDVYLIAQSIDNIDVQVRRLLEYRVSLRNVKRFKVAGLPIIPFNVFLAVWRWHAAESAIVKREAFLLNGIAKLYDTFGTSHGLAATDVPDAIWLPRPRASASEPQAAAPRDPTATNPPARPPAHPRANSHGNERPDSLGGRGGIPSTLASPAERPRAGQASEASDPVGVDALADVRHLPGSERPKLVTRAAPHGNGETAPHDRHPAA